MTKKERRKIYLKLADLHFRGKLIPLKYDKIKLEENEELFSTTVSEMGGRYPTDEEYGLACLFAAEMCR